MLSPQILGYGVHIKLSHQFFTHPMFPWWGLSTCLAIVLHKKSNCVTFNDSYVEVAAIDFRFKSQ